MSDRARFPAKFDSAASRSGDLPKRVASSVVMAVLAVAAVVVGGWPFVVFWTAAAIGVYWEWNAMVARHIKIPAARRRGGAAAGGRRGGLRPFQICDGGGSRRCDRRRCGRPAAACLERHGCAICGGAGAGDGGASPRPAIRIGGGVFLVRCGLGDRHSRLFCRTAGRRPQARGAHQSEKDLGGRIRGGGGRGGGGGWLPVGGGIRNGFAGVDRIRAFDRVARRRSLGIR